MLPGAPRVSTLQTPRRPHRTALQMARDLYETLGVPRGSDDRTIKRAFRDAARKWHPDVNDTPEAAERYKEISQAYATLSDPDKKQRYDMYGETGLGGGGGPGGGVEVNLEDIFDSFFGGGGGGFGGARRQQNGPIQGDDLRADLELDFKTACFGGQEKVRISHLEKCETCEGSGVKPGARWVLRHLQRVGRGHAGHADTSRFVSDADGVPHVPRLRTKRRRVLHPMFRARRFEESQASVGDDPLRRRHGQQARVAGEATPRARPGGRLVHLFEREGPERV